MTLLRLVLVLFSLSVSVFAEDFYVAQSATGSGSGIDAANAASVAFFNNATNWGTGAGKISPGDTVHVVGTVTETMFFRASGAAGLPITLLYEAGAKSSSPVFGNMYGAVFGRQFEYLVVDGGANGIIENTANGTGLANQLPSTGVRFESCKHLLIKNLRIRNIYVRTSNSDLSSGSGSNSCIALLDTSGVGMMDIKVTHCTLSDSFVGIDSDYSGGCSNYEFSYNTAFNCNWGGRCGDRGAGTSMNGLYIHHNWFYNWKNWNASATNTFHHNGFYGWAQSGGTLTNVQVYSNKIGPGYDGSEQTSGVFFSGQISNIEIFNNLFLAAAGEMAANGLITIGPQTGYTGFSIHNNTFVTGGVGAAINAGAGNATYTIKNNICIGGTFILFNYATASTLVSDYNIGYSLKSGQEFSYSSTSSSSFKSWAQWQTLGFDPSGSASNPNLDSNYVPQATFALVSGAPLLDLTYSLATSLLAAPLNTRVVASP